MGKKTILQILNEAPAGALRPDDAIVIDRPAAEQDPAATKGATIRQVTDAAAARMQAALDAKVDKHAESPNGSSTDVFNAPVEEGSPVMSGMAASAGAGSRRLLFVNTPGGVQVHLRKNKAMPSAQADLSNDDAILNKGEIDALVNDIMAALSQGLKTPSAIDKESDLPAASSAPNGAYYVVQNLDVTAPGQQGRAWKNNAVSSGDWQVVIDNVFSPDDEWISLTESGALTLHPDVREIVNNAAALTGKVNIFNDVTACAADAHSDIIVKRHMMKSDLRSPGAFMSAAFDGLIFRVYNASEGGNLRTEAAAASGGVTATIRRNTFYNSGVEGDTNQKAAFTETPTTLDATIYISSNDYSIYQIMVAGHWWEINLWCADAKESVSMSLERRL
jgi:hypothetical protein